jgi:hypothetical protein
MLLVLNLNLLALYAQIAVPVFAVLAIMITTFTTISDRRRFDRNREDARADLQETEQKRFEQELLIRLAICLEAGNDRVPEAKALILALGPSRLPQACELYLGSANQQEKAIMAGAQLENAWDRARAEVSRALRQGLPRRGVLQGPRELAAPPPAKPPDAGGKGKDKDEDKKKKKE